MFDVDTTNELSKFFPELESSLSEGISRAQDLNRPILVSVARTVSPRLAPADIFVGVQAAFPLSVFWSKPSEGFWIVGVGSAILLASESSQPAIRAQQEYRRWLEGAVVDSPPAGGVGPILLGGITFDAGAERTHAWKGFPDYQFTIPQFVFTMTGGKQWLTVNSAVTARQDGKQVLEQIEQNFSQIGQQGGYATEQPRLLQINEGSHQEWVSNVNRVLKDIETGQLTKVVLARRKQLTADGDFSVHKVLNSLSGTYPNCSIFALTNDDGSCFLGASPERLIRLERGRLTLSPLAGTVPRGETREEDGAYIRDLQSSEKTLHEHAAVVKMISETLRETTNNLCWNETPDILELETVYHLVTSFKGQIKPNHDLFDLLHRLHPTPAIAGTPTTLAIDMIRNLEEDRGWYGSPIGWIDSRGDGDFSIAIRCALLKDNLATLYAGAGIVWGSDPDSEFDETEWKFEPLLNALDIAE